MLCIHIFDMSPYSALLLEPDANSLKSQVGSWKESKKRKGYFTFRLSVYRPHVSSHLSLVYIHTMTLPLSVGTRCHHLAASGGWLGAGWVSPRYLWGATLDLTDRLTGACTHTCKHTQPFSKQCSLLRQYSGSHTPKARHTLHKAVTLLYIHFFSRHKIIFTPLASSSNTEVLKWIMETTVPRTHGIHFKMWESRCSQSLGKRNATLQVNESTIALDLSEVLL